MKIAFCFLVTYSIPTEKVWVNFFKKVKYENFYILIHGKPSLKLETKFFKANSHVIDPIETRWGHISLILAQNIMLKYATETLQADFCCILSGNCIPVKSFDYIYEDLDFLPISRFEIQTSYHKILKYKQSQWCVLSLEHIQIILKYAEKYIKYFEDINFTEIDIIAGSQDEYFYITLLTGQNVTNFLKNGSTYTKWNIIHGGHPKTYTKIKRKKLIELEDTHYFFMRKIQNDCVIEESNGTLILLESYIPFEKISSCDEFEMVMFSKSFP